MAGFVVNPIVQTTGSCVVWIEPRSRDMAKTVLVGPMGPKLEDVWLSNVPLRWNNPRQFESVFVLYVILPT